VELWSCGVFFGAEIAFVGMLFCRWHSLVAALVLAVLPCVAVATLRAGQRIRLLVFCELVGSSCRLPTKSLNVDGDNFTRWISQSKAFCRSSLDCIAGGL